MPSSGPDRPHAAYADSWSPRSSHSWQPPSVGAPGLVAEAAAPAAAKTASKPRLPFDMPSKATLRKSRHKVFANWVSSLPISLDNKNPASDYYKVNYLSPRGEHGKHAAYGGYLRDRPLGRKPLKTSSWRLADMKTEVRQAISEGIDGFTVVIYSLPSQDQPQLGQRPADDEGGRGRRPGLQDHPDAGHQWRQPV